MNLKSLPERAARRTEMTEKRMKKIIRRNTHRRIAQGIGATAGILVWAAAIGAYIVGGKKLDEYMPKVEDILAREKEAEKE